MHGRVILFGVKTVFLVPWGVRISTSLTKKLCLFVKYWFLFFVGNPHWRSFPLLHPSVIIKILEGMRNILAKTLVVCVWRGRVVCMCECGVEGGDCEYWPKKIKSRPPGWVQFCSCGFPETNYIFVLALHKDSWEFYMVPVFLSISYLYACTFKPNQKPKFVKIVIWWNMTKKYFTISLPPNDKVTNQKLSFALNQ